MRLPAWQSCVVTALLLWMQAEEAGTLTTRPVTFKGKNLFVNVDCPDGELKVEVLDEDSQV